MGALNMFKFVLSSCLAAAALSQYIDPEKAKILKEQRFNAGDGRFGAAYAQEDGTVYREETSADGERVGQYSYIDQAGKTITVRYTAGKDGFKILEGDHVPTGANGQNSAPYVATQAPPRAAPAPAQPQQFAQPAFQPASNDYDYYEDINPTQNTFVPTQNTQNFAPQPQQNFAPATQNTNPFINPHDPTHRDFRFNVNGGNFGSGSRVHSQSAVPPCADCAGVNPFINPFDNSPRNPQAFIPQQPAPTQAPRQQFQQQFQPQQQFTPTQAPRNFFPPGKLALNRFENGFNFDFTSQ